MAERAETLNMEFEAAEPMRLLPAGESAPPPKRDPVGELKRAASVRYEDAKTWAVESYARVAETSEIAAARIRRNFQTLRQQRPLLIVALAAGTAFALGVVFRVWRSKYDE